MFDFFVPALELDLELDPDFIGCFGVAEKSGPTHGGDTVTGFDELVAEFRHAGKTRPTAGAERREDARDRAVAAADQLALTLAAAQEQLTPALGRAAAAFIDGRHWGGIGFSSLEDHARENLGRSARAIRGLAAIGRAIDCAPTFAAAVRGDDGPCLGRSKVLALSGIVSEDNAAGWVAHARRVTVERLKADLTAARQAGGCAPAMDADDPGALAPATPPVEFDPETDPDPPRVLFELALPAHALAAFDEARDLHRRVSGGPTPLDEFVEALVADACAGSEPPDLSRALLRRGEPRRLLEQTLARVTKHWKKLDLPGSFHRALRRARKITDQAEYLLRRAGTGGAFELQTQLRLLLRIEDQARYALGQLLVEMEQLGAWSRLHFHGSGHYAVERLGLSRTTAEDLVYLHRALRRLPKLRAAHQSGRVGFEAALAMARALGPGPVAPEREAEWLAHVERTSIKRLRDEQRERRRRCCEHPGETARPLRDEEWFNSLERSPGESLARVWELSRAAAKSGAEDCKLHLRLGLEPAELLAATINDRTRRLTRLVESVPWDQEWPDPDPPGSVLAARTFSARARRVPGWAGLLAVLEEFALGADLPENVKRSSTRSVHDRAGYRCQVPGCTRQSPLHCHHVQFRAQGGPLVPENETCICSRHHRLLHDVQWLAAKGTEPLGVAWRLGPPFYGRWYNNERRLDENWDGDNDGVGDDDLHL
ncbi:MAG: HNH endonuclease [Acidobacteria bacterium]|nr:HNH endonuclease [Acidobacteriota bacterium]